MQSLRKFFGTPKKIGLELITKTTNQEEEEGEDQDATNLNLNNNNNTNINHKLNSNSFQPKLMKSTSNTEFFAVVIPIAPSPRKRSKAELALERNKVINSEEEEEVVVEEEEEKEKGKNGGGARRSSREATTIGFKALEAKEKAESLKRKAERAAKGKEVVRRVPKKKKREVEEVKPGIKRQRVNGKVTESRSSSSTVEDEDGDVDMETNNDSDEMEEDEGGLVSQITQDELASDKFSKAFTTMQTAEASLRVGQIVSFDTKGEEGVWLGQLAQIRGRLADITPALDANGNPLLNGKKQPRESCDKTYLQVRWLYDSEEFKVIPSQPRWSNGRTKPMGVRERVLTSHLEWKGDQDVLYPDPESDFPDPNTIVFLFEDSIPLNQQSHPLKLITHKKSGAATGSDPPLFYFGDDDFEQHESLVGSHYLRNEIYLTRIDPSKPLPFAPLREGVPPAFLTFNTHSICKKPYNPVNVQIFSPYADKWYSIADLMEKQSYKKKVVADSDAEDDEDFLSQVVDDNANDEEEEAGEEEEEEEEDAKSDGTDYDQPSTSNISTTARRSSVNKSKKVKKPPRLVLKTGSDELKSLAKSTILRGGAYGLIGNEWIVKEARSIVQGKSAWSQDYEDELIEAETIWKNRVGVRGRGSNGGKGKAKVVAKALGLPPNGMRWICPVVGKFI